MGDVSLFKNLFAAVSDLVCPPPTGDYPVQDVFLMELPGLALNADTYDPVKNSDALYQGTLLVNNPSKVDNHYVPTGGSIDYYVDVFTNAQKPTAKPSDEDIKTADKFRQEQNEYISKMEEAADLASNDFEDASRAVSERNRVLEKIWADEQDPDKKAEALRSWVLDKQLSQKVDRADRKFMAYYSAREAVMRKQEEFMRRNLGGIDSLVAKCIRSIEGAKGTRASSQTKFLVAEFIPSNWYNAFRTQDELPENEKTKEFKGWMQVSITNTSKESRYDKTLSKLAVSAEASYGCFFSASGGHSSSDLKESMSSGGAEVKISFEIARVRVKRPGIDSLLSLAAIFPECAILGAKAGSWSTGELSVNNAGVLPTYITSLIIARNVEVTSTKWSDTQTATLKESETNASFKVGIGPFSASGKFSMSNSNESRAQKSTFNGTTLKIVYPQIIGYVVQPWPKFPGTDA